MRGGRRKKRDGSGGRDEQAPDRSRGGFGTEIHGSFNGLGQPVVPRLTAGQASDIGQAEELLGPHEPEAVIADKECDGDAFVESVQRRGAEAVIPPRSNRLPPRFHDRHTYRERNHCERFWSKAKQFRRVATRYEKKATNFPAFVEMAAIMIMPK